MTEKMIYNTNTKEIKDAHGTIKIHYADGSWSNESPMTSLGIDSIEKVEKNTVAWNIANDMFYKAFHQYFSEDFEASIALVPDDKELFEDTFK